MIKYIWDIWMEEENRNVKRSNIEIERLRERNKKTCSPLYGKEIKY